MSGGRGRLVASLLHMWCVSPLPAQPTPNPPPVEQPCVSPSPPGLAAPPLVESHLKAHTFAPPLPPSPLPPPCYSQELGLEEELFRVDYVIVDETSGAVDNHGCARLFDLFDLYESSLILA